MRTAEEEIVSSCPQCGVEIRTDRRFTTWCAACEWNVDPQGPGEEKRGPAAVRRRIAQHYGELLFTELRAGNSGGRSVSGLFAYAIALTVHGLTCILAAVGVWGLIAGWGGLGMVFGLFFLALAWSLRPRLNRLSDDDRVLLRDEAPELYALVDEVAAVLGTRSVDAVVVDVEANASVTHLGLRRRLLTLGLPLWEVLSPQQRIALLGHELGHFTHGDTRHGMVVGTACRSLSTWLYYVRPMPNPNVVQAVTNLACVPLRLLVTAVMALLDLLTARASQRGEYLADGAAARTGSTEGAVGLMDRLMVTDSIATTLQRETNSRRLRRTGRGGEQNADGLWEALVAHLDSVPESECERRRRVGALRGHSVDASHPPTHLRRRLLLDGTPVPAAVTADSVRAERIAGELADVRATLARDVVRDGYGDL
ncbi:M48 family metallopeptidase [Streptomyces canus]|uniref:M48 family metallopeptidase n=1 Tax=Streptomyces canus TaxID=58343 RepID=UPI002788BE61|nr:M48 family metallopeptidase [Streptomyces canus]MDQ0763415.1 Zn-dependent protease with chaperone function [Streptomyces canus]MDQ1068100.1 Zn-dependent protease with chaperone function [Streptomyces canus]